MTVRLAVFDCDGTLSDGQAAVCAAMAGSFAEVGLPDPDLHQVRRIVGLSLPQAIARLVPDAPEDVRQQAVEAYKRAFFKARSDGSLHEPLFDGIAPLLAKLHDSGWTLGVATGKSGRGLAGLLQLHGIAGLFATLQTADCHPSKPHPSMLQAAMMETGATPEQTVMIGDTAFDMDMARAAGVRAVGVAWGYHETEELLAAGAVSVAGTPAQLEGLLDG